MLHADQSIMSEAAKDSQVLFQSGENSGMYRHYKGPFMSSGQAIWSCARPVCRRLRALGIRFLGRGQPADDRGGSRWAQKGVFNTTSRGIGGL
ncbi:MAG: hypothetical protein CMM32_06120 [Rhodospirillaceae bacterium]|nr:hypothetical protein [Rhodospirillaceae bacterium]